MLDRPSRIHACDCLRLQTVESELCKVSSALEHQAGGCLSLLTAGSFYPSPSLSLFFTAATEVGSLVFLCTPFLSFSLSCRLAHNPCQQRNCERKEHITLLSTSHPSLMLSRLILVVFREVPRPVTGTLHRHITAVRRAYLKLPMQSV